MSRWLDRRKVSTRFREFFPLLRMQFRATLQLAMVEHVDYYCKQTKQKLTIKMYFEAKCRPMVSSTVRMVITAKSVIVTCLAMILRSLLNLARKCSLLMMFRTK